MARNAFLAVAAAVTVAGGVLFSNPIPALAQAEIGQPCNPDSANACVNGAVCDTQSDGTSECCSIVWGCLGSEEIQTATGLGDEDPRVIIARVINVILGFLGIIAVILILAGGFIWMTAAGNDDKIAQAKKIMTAGVVGLVIVLAAFGLARFVVNALVAATTSAN